MKHVAITVKGRVQNVGFRHKAVQEATKHGITGFVMNQPDGTVYVEAEGQEGPVDAFIEWCKNGPNWARVDDFNLEVGKPKHFDDFSVRYRSIY